MHSKHTSDFRTSLFVPDLADGMDGISNMGRAAHDCGLRVSSVSLILQPKALICREDPLCTTQTCVV